MDLVLAHASAARLKVLDVSGGAPKSVRIFRLRGMQPAGDQRGELHYSPLETPMLESPPQAAG